MGSDGRRGAKGLAGLQPGLDEKVSVHATNSLSLLFHRRYRLSYSMSTAPLQAPQRIHSTGFLL